MERTTGFEPATLTLARFRDPSGWSRLVLPGAVPSGKPSAQPLWYRPVVERSTTDVAPSDAATVAS
jgi:hypothetical protein